MPYIKAISLFAIIAFYAIHFPSTNETGIQVSHDEFLSVTVHTQPWHITVYVRINSTDLSTVSVLLSFTCGGTSSSSEKRVGLKRVEFPIVSRRISTYG